MSDRESSESRSHLAALDRWRYRFSCTHTRTRSSSHDSRRGRKASAFTVASPPHSTLLEAKESRSQLREGTRAMLPVPLALSDVNANSVLLCFLPSPSQQLQDLTKKGLSWSESCLKTTQACSARYGLWPKTNTHKKKRKQRCPTKVIMKKWKLWFVLSAYPCDRAPILKVCGFRCGSSSISCPKRRVWDSSSRHWSSDIKSGSNDS